ncbi:matrix-remodeling-associated protein 7 isoform X2 [Labrus bergylta]|uniref:matrix-remodeling-associated protein 7 isoform X2 n=1 Tax=Labrus bergylta TaxID=56723 RepID=UPI003313746C
MDLTFVLSAAIFTLLAIVIATSLLNRTSSTADAAKSRLLLGQGPTGGLDEPGPKQNGHTPEKKEKKQEVEDDWCDISGSSHDHWDVVKSVLSTEGVTENADINDDGDTDENSSLKYVPGKARSHHLEMMMSTEELEEEQRVQREQLAAIFQLLKENKETFGDVSEGDMEEQLRLYSI